MSNVIDFPVDETVWECSCGCQAFYVISDGGNYIQCHECDLRVPVIMTLIEDKEAANGGE